MGENRIEELSEKSFRGVDLAFFCTESEISKKYIQSAIGQGAIAIDKSSAFRMSPEVPLIIPEINAEELRLHKGIIASPNCMTIIILMALAPLHKKKRIRRIITSTYQSASGAGAAGMEELWEETRAKIENRTFQRKIFPKPYAFNAFTHNSTLHTNGYVDEEMKLVEETRKILKDPEIGLSANCVRIPTLRAHAAALNVEFYEKFSAEEAKNTLLHAEGLTHFSNASPLDAEEEESVLYDRLREDPSHPHAHQLWKGAALNAVQIAELLSINEKTSQTNQY
jgi:aspartate-semialdehyde dehydrogenase